MYLLTEAGRLWQVWPLVAAASAAVLLGTIGGERILRRIPEGIFQRVVAAIILVLGIVMLLKPDQ